MVVMGMGCYVFPEDQVYLERSDMRFIRLQSPEFFRILEKLGWGLPHMAKPTSAELP